MQPADMRRAWTCPACRQSTHYIAGQDPVAIHAPQCPSIPAGTSARSAVRALRALDLAVGE